MMSFVYRLACFLLTGLLCCLFLGDISRGQAAGPSVTVMTYNIHHGKAPDGSSNLKTVARLIRRQDVDIVGLQEVDRHWSSRSSFADQARDLARRLNMNYFFAPIYDRPPARSGDPRRQYGLAILTRWPITAQKNHKITRWSSLNKAAPPTPMGGFPMVSVEIEGTHLRVYNTHLDYRADPAVRHQQVDDMLKRMGQEKGPAVLMGDLNAPPDAPELARLKKGFTDAWTVQDKDAGYTYPADAPTKRIDYIWGSPGLKVDTVMVLETTASDHRPVVARLSLPVLKQGIK